MNLNSLQNDRAAGVLVALAAGDALGAGYEFGPPLTDGADVCMKGGGPFGFEPAEWTDDTSMAIPIAEALLEYGAAPAAFDAVVQAWTDWARDGKDVGAQTRTVISAASRAADKDRRTVTAGDFAEAAAEFHGRSGRSAGNGSLMRTAPLALAYLHRDPTDLMTAAVGLSALTHYEYDAGEACGLWCIAIRQAVLTGQLDLRAGLALLETGRADLWRKRIETAERSRPRDFAQNGWVVEALQGAWSAITSTGASPAGPQHLRAALEEAVRGGNDTDTVAAIAGSLLGAVYGFSAVPFEWRRRLHGWPGLRTRDLMILGAELAAGKGKQNYIWPRTGHQDYSGRSRTDALVQHPDDDGVWLGGVGALCRTEELGIDAVVSLCRLGTEDVTGIAPENQATFWLVDSASPESNAAAAHVLNEAAAAVELFRAEGRTVLVHCVRAESRTPSVAALYGARVAGGSALDASKRVLRALPRANPNPAFREVLAAQDADAGSTPA
ncbi:hypothetical protein AO716_06305 [Arthrobacter sp. Edens01]|nr:hypothetical protein AO716_06305 [Arthrobacter sp. Edens01]